MINIINYSSYSIKVLLHVRYIKKCNEINLRESSLSIIFVSLLNHTSFQILTSFRNLLHFSTDSREFSRTHGNNRAVFSFRNTKLVSFNSHKIQVEFRNLITL